jgi:hypothetical protein
MSTCAPNGTKKRMKSAENNHSEIESAPLPRLEEKDGI